MSLLEIGATLLGGLLGKSDQPSAGQNAYSHVKGIVKAAEKFGFNPLTLLGSVSPMGGAGDDNAAFGQAIADAGLLLANDLAKGGALRAQVNQYRHQNTRLKKQLDDAVLRPTVPGVYGPLQTGGGDGSVSGAPLGGAVSDQAGGGRGGNPAGVNPSTEPFVQDFSSHGETTSLNIGPDADQVVTGTAIDAWNATKAWWHSVPKPPERYSWVPDWGKDNPEWFYSGRGPYPRWDPATDTSPLGLSIQAEKDRRRRLEFPFGGFMYPVPF